MNMETTRAIVLKLRPAAEQAVELDTTLEAFAAACNHIAEVKISRTAVETSWKAPALRRGDAYDPSATLA